MEPFGDNNAAATTGHEADPLWGGLIRWGGLSLFVAAVLLVVFVVVVVATGQELPVPPEDALDSPATPTFLFIVAVIGEVLLAPGGLARPDHSLIHLPTARYRPPTNRPPTRSDHPAHPGSAPFVDRPAKHREVRTRVG